MYNQFNHVDKLNLESIKTGVKSLISSINTLLIDSNNPLKSVWLSKKDVMKFFDYGDTQMRSLEKKHSLVCSKIGHRKFYQTKSILELIKNNIK